MNIQAVAQNLRATIAGKEKHLAGLQECIRGLDSIDCQDDSWFRATVTVEFLKINIDELQRILQDVEQCLPKEPEFVESDIEEGRTLIKMGR